MGHTEVLIQKAKVELADRTLRTKEQVPVQLASILATAEGLVSLGILPPQSLIELLLERYENGQDEQGNVPELVSQSLLSEMVVIVQAYFGFAKEEPSPSLPVQKPFFAPRTKHQKHLPSAPSILSTGRRLRPLAS